MPDIFEDDNPSPVIDDNRDYYPDLVGEGKQYKDNTSLAKSFMHKEMHIQSLEKTLQGLRDDLQARLTMEQVLDKITKSTNAPNPSNAGTPNPDETDAANQFTPEQLDSILEKKLSKRDQQTKASQNYKMVNDTLIERLGNEQNAKALIRDKAKELEVAPEFLKQMAEANPKAFLELVLPKQGGHFEAAPRSQINPILRPQGNVKNDAYYANMRKTDPKKYWSPQIQMEEHNQALKLGADFFQ